MNKFLIIAVALLLMANYTKAQNTVLNNNQINKTSTQPPFKVTKGYYSIYRNADKLNHQPITVVVNRNAATTYKKGVYAIGNKHAQLHKSGKSFIAITPKRPLTTKGYYSIKPVEVSTPEENQIADSADTMKRIREEN